VTPARLALLRGMFGLLQLISPRLAAYCAFHLFLRTFRQPLRAADGAILAQARQHRIGVGPESVAVYEWTGKNDVILRRGGK